MPSSHSERAAKMSPEARRLRARIAGRGNRPVLDDPDLAARAAEEIDDDRRELRALTLEEHVRRVVDQAPPLTAEQRERVAAVLRHPSATAEPA